MKRIKIASLAGTVFLWVFVSCGTDLNLSPSAVPDRFNESIDGKTKPIILPRDKDPQHFNFVWLTDMHIRTDRKDYMPELGNITEHNRSRFIITSGDLTDGGERAQYNHILVEESQDLKVPLYSALGNHDLFGDGWEEFKDKIGPSTASVKYGNSQLIILDTATCEVGRDQMDWLSDTLHHSTAKHKFIFTHFCLYNKVAELPIILCDPDERFELIGLLKKYQVDFYLCGHGHYAEEVKIGDTIQIQGATASAWNNPVNSKPEYYVFTIDGNQVDYDKEYFEDIDF